MDLSHQQQQQQQQHAHPQSQEHIEMHHDPVLAQQPYGFYPPEPTDPGYPSMPFAHHPMSNYESVPNAHPPRHMLNELHPAFQFRSLGLMSNHAYPNPGYPPTSPTSLNLPSNTSPPPPPSPGYDSLSPPVSGSDTSADGIYVSRNSSGTTSPSSSRGGSLVHRNSLRYNPTPSPSNSSSGRRRGRSIDSDSDEPNMMSVVQEIAHTRKEATRRQRIEAEQRRRDELRDGYARLKDVLPVSNQKSSKVSLLERATNYIVQLDKTTRQMQTRLAALEGEVQRLRALNEKISLSVGGSPEASGNVVGQTMVHNMERPLSPPPEGAQQPQASHNLVPVTSEPPREDSDGSDGGF